MNRERFDALVAKLEVRAKAAPDAFVRRTGAMAMLGFGYMIGVVVFSIAAAIGLVIVAIKFPHGVTIKVGALGAAAFAGLAWTVIKALWVRTAPPEGIELRRANAPKLFALIDEIREELRSPRFHHVLMVGDYNAAVVQVPRLGVFGWHRNYLLVGLLMLRGLSPEEFRAVLAHEFGHLSGNHGRFGNWLYRLRRSWERVFEQLMQKQGGKPPLLLSVFINWFWPRFNAHAFVLSRANEYEADAISARIAGSSYAASALQRSSVDGAFLDEEFWPAIFKLSGTDAEPPKDLYMRAGNALAAPHSPDATARWLRAACLTETNNTDTHPCLKDRLQALGAWPRGPGERRQVPRELPPPDPESAAHLYLAAQFDAFHQKVSESWRSAMAPAWQQRYREANELRERLVAVDTSAEATTHDGLWRKAQLLMDLEGDKAAAPVLDELLVLEPQHAGACFVRGRAYLATDDARGVELIERALKAELTMVPAGCELLYGYYTRIGERDQLKAIEQRMDAHHDLERRAQLERDNIRPADSFMPHGLTDDDLEPLRQLIASEPDISEAHIVRKRVQIFASSPCYVIAIKVSVAWWKPRSRTANQELIDRLIPQVRLNGHFLLFTEEALMVALGKAVRKVRSARVYARPRPSLAGIAAS